MPLQFKTAKGEVHIPDSYLLVAIDETGHERPSSPNHPVFGLGGCAAPVHKYGEWVREPWRRLKGVHFGSPDSPLHAADLRTPTSRQLDAFGAFFREGLFGRIAVLTSVATALSEPLPDYQLVARSVLERIARLVAYFGCDGAVLVHEEASRTDHLAAAYFEGYSLMVSQTSERLPFLKFKMPKAANEPFLEVADFVMHAAGGQVRASLGGRGWGDRKDFQAVFKDVSPDLAQFMDIHSVELAPINPRE